MSTNKFVSKGIECNCSSKMNALIMHLHKFMLYLLMGLLLSLYCYCLFLAFDSDNFDFWVLAGIVSTVLAGVLFYTYRFKKWRFGSFFLTVIVLLSFSLFSPVRPFLSFFFSLNTGLALSQVRTSLNHNFAAKSGFALPREDSLRLSEQEQDSGISKFLYVVDPLDGIPNSDTVVIEFDRENRLVAARYSSLIIPSI
jgi:hypothetical protein